MAIEDYLADVCTRRQIMIQRFANGTLEELRPVLDNLLEELTQRVATTGSSRARLGVLMTEVESLVQAAGEIKQGLRERVLEFAKEESAFQQQMFEEITDVQSVLPTDEQLEASVMGQATSIVV